MIYQLTQDSPHYIDWISSLPPVYCILCKLNLNLVVLIQIVVLLFGSFQITKFLNLKNKYLKLLAFLVAVSPIAIWGIKIGNDLLGYSLMLIALSVFHKNKKLFFIVTLVTVLTRWQYCFLFLLFLIDRQTIKYFLISCVLLFVIGFKCHLNPVQRLSIPLNYIATAYDTKPDKISHAVWFNKNLDTISSGTVDISKFDIKKFATLTGSKVYDNFRLHQLFVIPLLFLLGSWKVRFLLWGAMFHYSEVFIASSPYFQRHTFMIELCIILAMIKFYDDYKP